MYPCDEEIQEHEAKERNVHMDHYEMRIGGIILSVLRVPIGEDEL